MLIPPKDGEPKSKTMDGKVWHWCSIDHNNGKGKWGRHKEEDHNHEQFMKAKSKGRKPNSDKTSEADDNAELQLDNKLSQLSTALTALSDRNTEQDFA